MKTLMLVDGNSILNRAFYGIPPLSNKAGVPTNAVYGFFTVLLRHVKDLNPDGILVAFDVKAPTYRHELYPHYKEGRKPMPNELRVQFPIVKKMIDAMGWNRFEQAGLEADDILGILSARAEQNGDTCAIVTGDRDSLQLIGKHVTVRLAAATPRGPSDVLYDEAALTEKYGLTPKQMIDLKALMGDASDKIPGIPGVGEKTALNLLHTYGSLDEIYKHTDELKGALKTKVENGKKSAYLSKKLGTIVTESDLNFAFPALREANHEALRALLDEYELAKLADKLLSPAETEAPLPTESLPRRPYRSGEPLSVPRYVILRDNELNFYENGTILTAPLNAETEDLLREDFVTYDAKPLLRILERDGKAYSPKFDVMLALYVLNPSRVRKSTVDLCERELGKSVSEEDFVSTLPDFHKTLTREIEENGATFLYEQIELPLCAVLARMETVGFRADAEFLHAFSRDLAKLREQAEQTVYAMAGHEFNIYSPKQLGEVLFDELHLPGGRKTKTGYSTDNETLEKLALIHPIAAAVGECRRVAKLKSTYADGLAEKIASDGRIHTVFMQAVTQTGRISSVEPNLQNVPIRTELGRELRRAFSAADGCVLIDADYSQIELRLLAHIANDEAMAEAFRNGEDIHTATAAKVFRLPPELITPDLRSRAKAVNFGIVYGIGEYSLSRDLHVSRREAKEYIDTYLSTYRGVREFMDRSVECGKKNGYVETLFHRRRYVPELNGKGSLKAFGERVCMNAPIQGTAADLIKYAMVRVDRRLREEGFRTRLILQIHDELILESPEEEAEAAQKILVEEMEHAAKLNVPLVAESKIARNWYDTK